MLQVSLVREYLIWQEILPFVNLIGFDLERMRSPCTAPSTTHFHIRFLIDDHFTINRQIFHIHRTIPIHIPVTRCTLPIASPSIYAFNINTQTIIIQVQRISHNRNNRQIVFPILIYIRARNNTAGQVTILKEAETENSCCPHHETTTCTNLSICLCRCSSICGISKSCSFGNSYSQSKRRSKETSIFAYYRRIHTFCSKRTSFITFTRSWHSSNSPFCPSIHSTSIRSSTNSFGIHLTTNQLPIYITDIDGTTIIIQFIINLRQGPFGMMIKQQHFISLGWYHSSSASQTMLRQICRIVTNIASLQTYGLVCRIIQFHPGSIVERRINKHIQISSLYFINNNRLRRSLHLSHNNSTSSNSSSSICSSNRNPSNTSFFTHQLSMLINRNNCRIR